MRGAARVILIDKVAERLSFAQSKIPGLEVIDNSKVSDVEPLELLAYGMGQNLPARALLKHGAMVCIKRSMRKALWMMSR